MAKFSYTALDKTDSYLRGAIEAGNARQATATLEREGFFVINVREDRTRKMTVLDRLFRAVTARDLIFLTRNLATMLDAGMALDYALKVTAEQTTNMKFQTVLHDLHQRTVAGQLLHVSLARYPRFFSPFFVGLIKVGEQSGKLDQVLAYLLEQQERDEELRTKARGAMIYPSIIVVALLIMVVMMMLLVIPKITDVLQQYNVELPLTTRILIATSRFLINFWFIVFPGLLGLGALIRYWVRRPRGKRWWDMVTLRLPRVGVIIQEYNLARFARAMSALLQSGIAIDRALTIASEVTTNTHYRESVTSATAIVQKGVPLSDVLKGKPKLYPPLTIRMVEVGEKTGKLDDMVTRLAVFYEKSVLNTLNNLSAVIEPVLLLLIGLAVGFVAVAVLTPIWSFSKTA